MLRPTPTAVSGQLQPDPPQWLGGRFRAQQDRHRHDQGLPGRQWRPGRGFGRVRELVESLTKQVVNALVRNRPGGGTFHIEDVQDQVELALMRSGEHDVARSYVLYREKRTQERAAAAAADAQQQAAAPSRPVAERDRQRRAPSARYRRPARHHRSRRRGPDRVHRHRSDPEGNRQESVRRHPRGRSVQVRHPVRPRAGRERPGLQPGHCPPAAARSARKCWARKSRRPT